MKAHLHPEKIRRHCQ